MLMWVGWDRVDATSTPFTVTVFWAILPAGEKTYRYELWELGRRVTRNIPHCRRERRENCLFIETPGVFPA